MQVLLAGNHKFILLELDPATIEAVAESAGFKIRINETDRALTLDLTLGERANPILLFDAADPANLGWFSRCQFYIDGRTGGVLQTPITVANKKDRSGRRLNYGLQVKIAKELPSSFRLPGRQPMNEQVFYSLFNNFLQALTKTGVAVCGGTVIQPLAGRTEAVASRN